MLSGRHIQGRFAGRAAARAAWLLIACAAAAGCDGSPANGGGTRGPVTKTLQDAFFAIVTGRDSKYESWLSYI